MDRFQTAIAKLAGLQIKLRGALAETNNRNQITRSFSEAKVGSIFEGTKREILTLADVAPDLFGDFAFPQPGTDQHDGTPDGSRWYSRGKVVALHDAIEGIFAIRSHSQLATPMSTPSSHRVFISHGRSKDWMEVQAYLEKDVGVETLELAQEANLGRTIIAKLSDEARRCDVAVIVMTGDDTDSEGQVRARENVIHEIGFFQGRYGLDRVILLHEEGVSIPSNIHGVVYSPFPKGYVHAAFVLVGREIKAMYR